MLLVSLACAGLPDFEPLFSLGFHEAHGQLFASEAASCFLDLDLAVLRHNFCRQRVDHQFPLVEILGAKCTRSADMNLHSLHAEESLYRILAYSFCSAVKHVRIQLHVYMSELLSILKQKVGQGPLQKRLGELLGAPAHGARERIDRPVDFIPQGLRSLLEESVQVFAIQASNCIAAHPAAQALVRVAGLHLSAARAHQSGNLLEVQGLALACVEPVEDEVAASSKLHWWKPFDRLPLRQRLHFLRPVGQLRDR
mmetsp:Transcript_62693/g.159429  ORF Transcript_62693/g.159429 Transcript_62693/m.159429 type:complete len:254 (-) Transcript_62693:847-1608(-)